MKHAVRGKPLLVVILAAIDFLIGLGTMLIGLIFLVTPTAEEVSGWAALALAILAAVGPLLFLVGLVMIGKAYLLYTGSPWGLYLTLIVGILAIVLGRTVPSVAYGLFSIIVVILHRDWFGSILIAERYFRGLH